MQDLFELLRREIHRQAHTINLIPSENYPSPRVLRALGSVFNNKYSEGYPGRRYYPGNEVVDEVEEEAIRLVRKLFRAEHANVQPLSGALANAAVYYAFMKPGEVLLALDLKAGGHLTHGAKVNFSGRFYRAEFYSLDENGFLDYDVVEKKARETRPRVIVAGYSAYPRDVDWKRLREVADDVGARLLADIAHTAGLVAAGEQNDPVPYADAVTFTTQKTLRGPRGAVILCREEDAERIDRAVFPGVQAGPHMHSVFAKAVCFSEALQPEFREYARQIRRNAKAMAKVFLEAGIPLSTGGTDNHLMLLDLRPLGMLGAEAQARLEKVGITVNKNLIPRDPGTPAKPSGIRPGTPAITSRGMKEAEAEEIASLVVEVLRRGPTQEVRGRVKALCQEFPLPYSTHDLLG